MLSFIIRLFENFLNFLKEKKEEDTLPAHKLKDKKTGKLTKIIIILTGIGLFIFSFIFSYIIFFEASRNRDISLLTKVILIFITIILNIFLTYNLFKNINLKYIILIHIPIYIGLLSLSLFLIIPNKLLYLGFSVFSLISSILLIFYPLIYILQKYIGFLNNNIINKFKTLFQLHNLAFFFLLTVSVLLVSIGFNNELIQPWSEGISFVLNGANHFRGFYQGLIYIIILPIVLLYGIYTLHTYYDDLGGKRINLHYGIGILLVIYMLGFTTEIKEEFYENQIKKAQNIIYDQGENYESYNNAKVMFLDSAFLARIKKGRSINEELFQKLYDTNPEGYYGEKISKYRDTRTSFETNSSKIGDSAEVIFKMAEIENNIFVTNGEHKTTLLETVYKFHFTNTSDINQEVILNFETPNKNTVISGLRLGLDLELIGQVSSRGAAKKVYEDSLRRNIDPALIEKVGLNTYNLRVFPIPSKRDKTSQGKQLVEITMLTPLDQNELTYSPKLSIINLKFDNSSRLISKIYDNEQLVKEDIIKGSKIEDYISSNHVTDSTELSINIEKSFDELCLYPITENKALKIENLSIEILGQEFIKKIENGEISNRELVFEINNKVKYEKITSEQGNEIIKHYLYDKEYTSSTTKEAYKIDLNNEKDIGNKISIFFDNSTSIDRNNANKLYSDIYSKIKNFDGKLNDIDLFSYNFDVTKLSEIQDIDYWGYSNIDRTIDYIINNKIKNQNIILVTDDDNFNIGTQENNTRNLESLITNNINVIKIGKKVKSYKTDFNTLLASTNGNIYEINNKSDIDNTLNKIFDKENGAISYTMCEPSFANEENLKNYSDIKKIQAGIIGNLLLSKIKNEKDWYNIAKLQSKLAENNGIVNQFNSLIALQTEQQQRDLDRYNKENSKKKYDSKYENFGKQDVKSIFNEVPVTGEMEESLIDRITLDNVDFNNKVSNNSIGRTGGGINFGGERLDSGLRGSNASADMRGSSISFSGFSGNMNISIVGLIIMLTYLLQYIGVISFIIKYIRGPKKETVNYSN